MNKFREYEHFYLKLLPKMAAWASKESVIEMNWLKKKKKKVLLHLEVWILTKNEHRGCMFFH